MEKWLHALFIPICLLFCFIGSAGAGPRDCQLPIEDCRLAFNAEVTQTGIAQTNQDTKTTGQEKKPAVNLQDYVGRYEADPSMLENFILDVFLEKEDLWIKPSHSPKRKLIAKSGDTFVITDMEIPHKFNRDAKGLVQSLTIEGAPNGQSVTAKKLVLPAASLKGSTTFRLKGYPNARVVAVAGSFNDWKQSQVLCGKEGEAWVCRIDLAPGKYTYKFIIDGDWILDPDNANSESDERGFENSVLVVK